MSKRQLHTVEERRADKKRFEEMARAALGNSILWRNAVPTKRGSRKWQGQLWVVVAVVVTDMSKRQLHTVEERRADKKRFEEKATAALECLPLQSDVTSVKAGLQEKESKSSSQLAAAEQLRWKVEAAAKGGAGGRAGA
eukprot:g9647.t1